MYRCLDWEFKDFKFIKIVNMQLGIGHKSNIEIAWSLVARNDEDVTK